MASNASTLTAMRIIALPLLRGRAGDDLPPLPFASRPLAALVVVAGRDSVPRGLMAHVAAGTGAGSDLLPLRTGNSIGDQGVSPLDKRRDDEAQPSCREARPLDHWLIPASSAAFCAQPTPESGL
jgi:hypothetical protein